MAVKLTKSTDQNMQVDALKLLFNLSYCGTIFLNFPSIFLAAVRSNLTQETSTILCSFLDPKLIQKTPSFKPSEHVIQVQKQVLEILGNLALAGNHSNTRDISEHPREVLGPKTVILAQNYLRIPSGIHFDAFEWNMGIMFGVMALLRNLMQNGMIC